MNSVLFDKLDEVFSEKNKILEKILKKEKEKYGRKRSTCLSYSIKKPKIHCIAHAGKYVITY